MVSQFFVIPKIFYTIGFGGENIIQKPAWGGVGGQLCFDQIQKAGQITERKKTYQYEKSEDLRFYL